MKLNNKKGIKGTDLPVFTPLKIVINPGIP